MSRQPSEATELKKLRREVRQLRSEAADLRMSLFRWTQRTKEAEASEREWRERFDILLRNTEGRVIKS